VAPPSLPDPAEDAAADAAAVSALVVEYAHRLDHGDLDGVARLFAHGTFRSARGTELAGAEAVRHVYDPVVLYADGTPRTKHVLGNLEVTVDAPSGTATARCTFTVLQAAPGLPLQPVLSGRYHDTFVKTGGEWRYAERMVCPDLAGDLSHHMAGGGGA
jgi:SnoaL-like domain